jgi:MOB kinase activator 1
LVPCFAVVVAVVVVVVVEQNVSVVGAAQPQQQQQPMLVRGPFMYPPAEHTARTQAISERQQKLVWRKGDVLDPQCAYPPKDTVLQAWLAAHLIDFVNCLNSIVSSVYPACSCVAMTAGSAFTYKWQNEHTGDRKDLTARAFIDRTFEFVTKTIKQEIVPQLESSTPVPLNNFEKLCEKVFKQLFRVWAHLFKDHYTTMGELDVLGRAHLAFKWFAFFVVEHKLLTEKEILPLKVRMCISHCLRESPCSRKF